MYGRLLVGYEDTEQGHDALALGAVLGRTTGATVLVASVSPPDLPFASAGEHRRQMEAASERLLAQLPSLPRQLDLAPEARCLVANSAAAGLRRLAANEGADAIVLGSTHRGALGRVLPGSVGERLLGGSPCPVAVAPRGYARDEVLASEDPRPRVIGVGYDGSEEGEDALRAAAALAGEAAATLRVIAVGQPYAHGPAAATAETQAWSIEASYLLQDRLQEVVGELPGELRPQAIYLRGDPAAVLVKKAEEGIDLLVIGGRGRGPLRGLAGSVCGRVMREAPCPVLVVPVAAPRARVPSAEMKTAVRPPEGTSAG